MNERVVSLLLHLNVSSQHAEMQSQLHFLDRPENEGGVMYTYRHVYIEHGDQVAATTPRVCFSWREPYARDD